MQSYQVFHLDYETRSAADISLGSYEYSCHPSTRAACLSACNLTDHSRWFDLRFDLHGDRRQPWPFPYAAESLSVEGWNVSFEQNIWRNVLGWPEPGMWVDTMALASANGLPTTLAGCAEFLKLGGKDKDGQKVMRRVCIPGKDGTFAEPTDQDWTDLQRYCRLDVQLEMDIADELGELPGNELAVWEACNRINQRGMPIDRTLCARGQAMSAAIRDTLGPKVALASGGALGAVDLTRVEALQGWVAAALGETLEDLDATTVANLLKRSALPDHVRTILEARRFVSKISVRKLAAYLERTETDGRLRGQLKYRGAQKTGRWASEGEQSWRGEESGCQVQNLAKPPKGSDPAKAVAAVLSQDLPLLLEAGAGEYESALKCLVRPAITPVHGNVLIVCDYAAIEGRGVLWLAGDEKHLEWYRDYDAGTGPEPYCTFASKILGRLITKDMKAERNAGKVPNLGCNYAMGPDKLDTTAKSYGIDLAACGTTAKAVTDWFRGEFLSLAGNYYNGGTDGLWKRLDKCCLAVVDGEVPEGTLGYLRFRMGDRGELRVRLPSGNVLIYNGARVEWVEKEFNGKTKRIRQVVYDDYSKSKNAISVEMYGGKWTENMTQAVCRDLLADALVRCEAAGLPVVLHVHDEIVCEVPESEAPAALAKLEAIMREAPAWAKGMPINVEGYCTKRYAKSPLLV